MLSNEELVAKLELLVKMTGAKLNREETLLTELDEIKEELALIKAEKKALKAEMTDERYFDAALEIVDRNLVIGLKKQIALLTDEDKQNSNRLNELIKDEEVTHVKILEAETEVNSDKEYLESIEERLGKLTKDGKEETADSYKDALSLTKEDLKQKENEQAKLQEKYDSILEEMETIKNTSLEHESLLKELNDKLENVNEKIANKDSYINVDLKSLDDQKMATIDEKIKALDERKLKIITDPVYIISEIKEALNDNDMVLALSKTKDLVNNILSLPFMDIDTLEEVEVLKANLENEKASFEAEIASKSYNETNLESLQERVVYLNSVISNLNESIDFICKQISKTDNNSNVVNSNLKKAIMERDRLSNDITSYQNILDSDLHMAARKKNSIKAILSKKEEELKAVNMIIQSYKKEELNALNKVQNLENVDLMDLKNQIKLIEEEKDNLNKLISSLKSKNKDVLAEESDLEIVHEFDEKINALNNRLEFNESISSIKNAIDEFFNNQRMINEELTSDLDTPSEGIVFDAYKIASDEESLNDELPGVEEQNELVNKTLEPTENTSEFIDFDENKFNLPESDVVSIDDILNNNTGTFESISDEDSEPVFLEPEASSETVNPVTPEEAPLFSYDEPLPEINPITDLESEVLTEGFIDTLPSEEENTEEKVTSDTELIEILDVKPIIVENN